MSDSSLGSKKNLFTLSRNSGSFLHRSSCPIARSFALDLGILL
nr:MAG TPA: hypothetical protein [Bacteriophage sp.]DAW45141.1 MAG TPA: hypothetical protein [Bacteriophage sp.]